MSHPWLCLSWRPGRGRRGGGWIQTRWSLCHSRFWRSSARCRSELEWGVLIHAWVGGLARTHSSTYNVLTRVCVFRTQTLAHISTPHPLSPTHPPTRHSPILNLRFLPGLPAPPATGNQVGSAASGLGCCAHGQSSSARSPAVPCRSQREGLQQATQSCVEGRLALLEEVPRLAESLIQRWDSWVGFRSDEAVRID